MAIRPERERGKLDHPMIERWRIVVDTNVVVAALLHPGRAPDRALSVIDTGLARVIVDGRIVEEYREVLGRPKFRSVAVSAREALLDRLLAGAEHVVCADYPGPMVDPDDRAFVEVCLSGRADVLLTGNGRHFPTTLGFAVLAPTEWLHAAHAAHAP